MKEGRRSWASVLTTVHWIYQLNCPGPLLAAGIHFEEAGAIIAPR